jgi:hypothetical protein
MRRMPRMIVKQIWIWLLLSCAVLQPRANAVPCENVTLPDEANAVLKARFPGLQIVTLADLDQDERQAWSTAHPGMCPGIASGKFDPAHKITYAVSLFRPLGNYRYREALVLLTQEEGKYFASILSPESEVTAHVYVVWQQSAGAFKDAETGKRVRAVWPIITYEAIEAGATAYYWQGSEFKSFVLSQ